MRLPRHGFEQPGASRVPRSKGAPGRSVLQLCEAREIETLCRLVARKREPIDMSRLIFVPGEVRAQNPMPAACAEDGPSPINFLCVPCGV